MDFDLIMLKFKEWMLNPIIKLLFILSLLGIVGGISLYGFHLYQENQELNQLPYQIKNYQNVNKKYFDVLNQKVIKESDGSYVVIDDLFMKKPFLSAQTTQAKLDNYCSDMQKKYNISKRHPKLRAIGIRLYDRKIVYDNGLTPRGTAIFALDPDYAESVAEKQDKKDQNQTNVQAIDPTNPNKNGQNITNNTNVSPIQQAWNQTIDPGQTKDINYKNYVLTVDGLQSYTRSAVNAPLSDQEFAFWLKIKEYMALLNTNNVDSAVQLYLNYDLNGLTDQKDFLDIAQEFEDFNQRETELGDNTQYFPNKVLLKQAAAVYRPQLLYFILSNGKMIDSYSDAQKALIKLSQSKYAQPIRKHVKQVSQDVDTYGKVNYYETYIDGKLRNTDPFSGTTGKKRVKKRLYFVRPQFSPNPIENNAFYPLVFGDPLVSGQD